MPSKLWYKGEVGDFYRQCSFTQKGTRCANHSVLKFYNNQGLSDIIRYRCGYHPVAGWEAKIVTTPEYKMILTKKES